jgi:hypothetical protein
LASLIAWVRHSTSAEDVAVRLERSIGLIVGDENQPAGHGDGGCETRLDQY